ncbi:hypothetical protein [Nocardia macrotermitis]|uniref:Secreted protein n=1 Tax=Nocardia macrotermitis TaxID=2585198 RepID=A0A7K0D2E9_9NOCA|nr:hypothetical protein [Nocardia macrotermitis]MQY19900.1 hypothetical protein [Nocardia macrotermitis]
MIRKIVTATALTAGLLGGFAALGSAVAQATPIGTVNCGSAPIGSKLVTTCTNTDLGPGTMNYSLLCTNLVFEWYHTERIGPNSTQTMVRDCGPGAHPILWGSSGITDYQQLQNYLNQQNQQALNH